MSATKSPRDRLADMFEGHHAERLPSDSTDGEITLAHARLVYYDSRVAGVVTSVLGGHPVEAAWLEPDRELDSMIDELLASKSPSEQRLLRDYRRYKQRLDRLLALAGEALKNTRAHG